MHLRLAPRLPDAARYAIHRLPDRKGLSSAERRSGSRRRLCDVTQLEVGNVRSPISARAAFANSLLRSILNVS